MNKNIDYKRLDLIQGHLDRMVSEKQTAGCLCLVIKDGREVGYYEAGLRDIDKNEPITRDTIFRLYSMSKPITSVAVMQLMENGLLDILDPVSKFLPGFKNQKCYENGKIVDVKNEVTIKNLLDMTSGLCYGGECLEAEVDTDRFLKDMAKKMHTAEEPTTIEFANAIGKLPLAFEPDTRWNYGLSADVLGAIVEIVSGMSFSEYLRKNIFEPLEMRDTGFFVPEEKMHRLAKTYTVNELKHFADEFLLIRNDENMSDKSRLESGGAGIVSTVDDYSKINMMLLNGGEYKGKRILHPETVKFMTAGSLTEEQRKGENWISLKGYTYGNLLRVLKYPGQAGGLGSIGEYGWDGWTGVYMANIPEHNMCIIYMMQRSECGTIDITRKLRNIIFSALV